MQNPGSICPQGHSDRRNIHRDDDAVTGKVDDDLRKDESREAIPTLHLGEDQERFFVMIGKTISHYRILALLGGGGMGVVYEAEDVRLGRRVALKFLPPKLARDPEALQRFQREARAASALNHPNICTIYDIGEHDAGPYIVMERLDGVTLCERLEIGRLPPDELLDAALQLAGALEAAGGKGIVHRDIKPANVFLTKTAGAKILDFGIAKLAESPDLESATERVTSANLMTVFGTMIGTVPYMSPEQVRAEPVDARTDIFSFGVVLYEMATGHRPFTGKDASLVVDAILHTVPPAPEVLIPGLPQGLTAVIMRALEKDVRLRYQTAADLRADLLRVHRGPSTSDSTIAMDRRPVRSLSPALTSFVGRREELDRVIETLAKSRLVTLTGPGGTGKTRLALRAAEEVQERFSDGVFFVELEALHDPNFLPSTIAQAVGLREVPGVALSDGLARFLSGRNLLLVLDNFEQLAAAAPWIAELLSGAPKLVLLVTSRARLHVSAEAEVPVPPLRLPESTDEKSPENLLAFESVALFCERAATVKPGFGITKENAPAIAQLCARLDGLPLAIELAAARIRHLAPAVLLQRLSSRLSLLTGGPRDLPARQQTLRDAIAWSHDLLSTEEQVLFARLAIFHGGFTLDAAETVCSEIGALDLDILDGVASLVDNSMLRLYGENAEPRYAMLETIRDFGLERLAARGEEQRARQAHALFFGHLASETPNLTQGQYRKEHLIRLRFEHANLRAALDWCASGAGDARKGARILVDLERYWVISGLLSEGSAAHLGMLSRLGPDPTLARASVLSHLGIIQWLQGDHEAAAASLEECLRICRPLGNDKETGFALMAFGLIEESRGHHAEARRMNTESAEIYRRLGYEYDLMHTLVCAIEPDDLVAARRDGEEALAFFRAHGDAWQTSRALRNLGVVAFRGGDFAEARRRLEELLSFNHEVGDHWMIARGVTLLGDVARCLGDLSEAKKRYDESRSEEKVLGSRANAAWSLAGLGHVALLRGEAAHASELFREALFLRLAGFEKPEHVASCLIGLAEIKRIGEDLPGAAECLAAAAPFVADAGRRMVPVDAELFARNTEILGASALETATIALVGLSFTERIRRICKNESRLTKGNP